MTRSFDGGYGLGMYGGKPEAVFETVSTKASAKAYVSCYHSHPVLKLGEGRLIGGRSSDPVTSDADVYIDLQGGAGFVGKEPWEKPVQYVQYLIADMRAPASPTKFRTLVEWVVEQLVEGKTVHAGCIGGHGRTGTLFAAVVAVMLGEKEAIQWVRKNYCEKAVESAEQVDFLCKHYGVLPAKTTKSHAPALKHKVFDFPPPKSTGGKEIKSVAFRDADRVFTALHDRKKLIWGNII